MCNWEAVSTRLFVVVLATMIIQGCAGIRAPTAGTYDGPSRDVGAGRAYAFVTLDTGGKPTAVGIRMSETALSGLPAEPPQGEDGWAYVLLLPKEAAGSGYDHIMLDWNPKGHIPPGVYDTPHFDFHFYLISQARREKITAKGEDLARARRAPAPEFMPEGYVLPEGTEVPRMGAHAIDPRGPEFNGQPFTKTFIYGFYDGSMVFLEPMVSQAFLETKPNVSDLIRLPKAYSLRAYYPTRYTVNYDDAKREYVISLENLVLRP